MKLIVCLALLVPVVAFPAGTPKKPAGVSEIARAEKAVSDRLKDPSSAQFRDVHYISDKHFVCGQFNAKNSYGAYVGFAPFGYDDQGKVHEVKIPRAPSVYAMQHMTKAERDANDEEFKVAKEEIALLKENCRSQE